MICRVASSPLRPVNQEEAKDVKFFIIKQRVDLGTR
jgi:hypothetical protein